jgi:ferredoxin
MADDGNQAIGTKTLTTSDGKKITVQVDRNLCIGAATCIAVAPKMFVLDNEAKAILLDTSHEESYQSIMDAAKSCPVAAIIIQDETGNKVYPA